MLFISIFFEKINGTSIYSYKMLRLLTRVVRGFGDLPPFTTLGMPSLSPTMTTGKIIKWVKKEGDRVKPGEVMFEVETDKATLGFEVQDEVFVAKILEAENSAPLALGHPVAILVDKADRVAAFKNYSLEPKKEEPQVASPVEKKIKVSPAAFHMIEANHLDSSLITPTGPKGLILKEDVLKYLESKNTKQTPESNKTIPAKPVSTPKSSPEPKKPSASVQKSNIPLRAPRFTVSTDINIDKALALVGQNNLNEFFIKTAAICCKLVPEASSKFFQEFMRFYDYVDIQTYFYIHGKVKKSFIKDSQNKRLDEIKEALKSESSEHHNFSISFATNAKEIKTPNSTCLLSIGPEETRVVSENNNLKPAKFIKFSLNCDHRAVDGAVGATWLKNFKGIIENPISLL